MTRPFIEIREIDKTKSPRALRESRSFHLIDFPLIREIAGTVEWAHCSKSWGQGRGDFLAEFDRDEARAANEGGGIDEDAMEAIRRGWDLGKESFKDRLLRMLEDAPARTDGGSRRTAGVERDHGQKEALRIVREGCRMLGLSLARVALAA